MRVQDLYHPVVVTADAGESLASAAGRMVVHGIGSRAVLSDGQFAGIVTERDLARAVADDADTAVTPVRYYLSVAPASATQEDVQEVAGRMLEPGMRPLPGHRRGHARDQEDLRDAMRAPPQPVMGRVLVAVRRHPLAAYFLLAYAFSWGYWLPLALTGGHSSHFPGLLGPMLAALVVTPIVQGRAGLRDLLSRMGRWRVPLRWYVVASVPVVAGVLALGGLWVARGDMPSLAQLSTMPGLPAVGWVGVFILALVVNGYGEETGWRGVAWPRLRERHSLGGAALLLALPWAIWHAPTFWLDTGMRGFPMLLLPGFFIGMAAGAVVLGWLYERAHCSVLIVALFHAMLNMASATKGTEELVATVVSTVVIVWAVTILRAEGRRGSRREPGPSGYAPMRGAAT